MTVSNLYLHEEALKVKRQELGHEVLSQNISDGKKEKWRKHGENLTVPSATKI